jgi:penicillin-binding protein A
MSLWRWIGIGAAVGALASLWPLTRSGPLHNVEWFPLAKLTGSPARRTRPSLEGLDLLRMDVRPSEVTSPLPGGKTAVLTLDPVVQRVALRTMHKYRVPEAGVVAIAVKTGRVIAYASQVQGGEKFDVNVRAEPPAASIFKIVTGSALVEKAGLKPSTEQCYRGGRSEISADELKPDPARDKWCATLGTAMGRSLNVVFGRLAQKHLTPEDLTEMAGRFGFGASVPFAVKNDALALKIPDDPVEFARTAAGFWNTSLSPLAAAVLAQTIANGGVALEPRIVSSVREGRQDVYEFPSEPKVLRRAIQRETADALTTMMLTTVADGSAYKVFHDERGRAFLPNIEVAGKTGTLTRERENRHYTWLVAFAPARDPEIAIAAVIVNTPEWQIKGPHLAREVLRAYFASQGRPGVTAP